MKRLFLLMAVIVATALTATAQTAPKRHGWEENFSLYGDVERVEINTYELYEYDGNLICDEVKNTNIYEFNRAGNVFRSCCFGSDGNLIYMNLYSYNSMGKCSALTEYDSKVNLTKKYEYFYDSEGKLTEIHRYDSEETFYLKEVYSYDQNGNNTLYEHQNPDGTLEVGYFFVYDEHNNLVREGQYDYNRIKDWEIKYSFHRPTTNLEEKVIYFYTNNTEQRWTYEYNEHGERIREYYYNTEGNLKYKIIYEYDPNGVLVGEYCFDSEMNSKWSSRITFDTRGNKSSQVVINSQGDLMRRFSYEYDSSNNPIKSIKYYSPEEGSTSEFKQYSIIYRTE